MNRTEKSMPDITTNSITTDAITTDAYPLEGAVEALLFVSDEPVSAATLAKILDRTPTEVDTALSSLATRFEEEERGIQLREVAGGWRLYSHPAFHDLIERYVISWDTRSLSQAALEALAVIAYHQPTTRAGVNGIRGVNSDAVISTLVEKGLVREAGRDSGPGNAILYATTRTFLEKFGLKSLRDLPPLEDFAPDEESRDYIRTRLSGGKSPVGVGSEDSEDPEDLELVD
jgi:segregation and condensation protein B